MLSRQTVLPHVEFGRAYRVGPHVFVCGDLERGDWDTAMRLSGRGIIPLVYSDPPWNAGNCRYWRGHAGRDRGRVDYGAFARLVCAAFASCRSRAVYCEQSINPRDNGAFLAAAAGTLPPLAGRFKVHYGAPVGLSDRLAVCRRPNLLLRFANHGWAGDPTGLHGEAMTRHVFEHEPEAASSAAVADPCVGKGMTARMAHRFGLACVGMEINPARLAVTLGWLSRQGMEIVAC